MNTSDSSSNNLADSITDVRAVQDQEFLEMSKEIAADLEFIRIALLKNYEFRKKIAVPVTSIVGPICGYIDYILLTFSSSDRNHFAGLSVVVLGLIYMWVTSPRREYTKNYKEQILPAIARLFGDLRFNPSGSISMDSMLPSKIVPKHDRYSSEDYFSGVYKGVTLQFSEITLKKKKRSGKRTIYVEVFKGLALLLKVNHKRFLGHTVLDYDRNCLLEWFKERSTGLERAELVDPEFEKLFDVYTNDQVEARYLIDPLMIERFKGLYSQYKGNQLAAAFYDRCLLVLISSKYNHFEPPDIYTSATSADELLRMKREVGEVLSIIDHLNLYTSQKRTK